MKPIDLSGLRLHTLTLAPCSCVLYRCACGKFEFEIVQPLAAPAPLARRVDFLDRVPPPVLFALSWVAMAVVLACWVVAR